MTRSNFIQQATLNLVRAGSTQQYAISEAVRLKGVDGQLVEKAQDRRAFSVSVYLQAVHGNSVFLVKHKRLDLWLPIGGERQGDETPLETAKRKVREETGWNPKAFAWTSQKTCLKGPAGLLGYEEHTAGDRGLHMNFVFTARVLLGSGLGSEPISDGSWSSYAWSGPTQTPVPVPPNVAEVLHLLGQTPQQWPKF